LASVTLRVLVSILFLSVTFLFAGEKFDAQPGETVVPGQMLVKFRPGTNVSNIVGSLGVEASTLSLEFDDIQLVTVPPALYELFATRLAAQSSVVYVEPNRVRSTQAVNPNDPSFATQWALNTVKAVKAWGSYPGQYYLATGMTSGRVKVAVLDTGADCTHPDFKNAGGTSVSSSAGGQLNMTLSKADYATTRPSPACTWQDDHGHGTHTAGIIGASANNGTGIAGLAYGAELLIYRVLDQNGTGSDSAIARGITWAADAGARIISMSLGGIGYSQTLQDAVTYAWRKNALVVAAAGNNNSGSLFFPAGANNAFGVAATDSADKRASFSNYGDYVDIAAPGVGVYSTLPTYTNKFSTNYGSLSGTSMATPYVAALAALLAAQSPGLAPSAMSRLIQQSAASSDATGGWNDKTGYGVIRADDAVNGNLRTAVVGSIVGQVTNATGTPITGATVTVGLTSKTTVYGGLFRFANLTPGTYTVAVSASGYASQNLQVVVVAGGDTTVIAALGTTPGLLRGTVTSGGSAVPLAAVQAFSGSTLVAESPLDATGNYLLNVPPGTYEVRATAPGYAQASATGNSVTSGGTTTRNLTMTALGRVSGVVTGTDGAPVPGAQVTFSSAGYSFGAVTDETGHFQTQGAPAGTYSLYAFSGATEATATGIVVTNGTTVLRNISLAPSGATVTVSPAVVMLKSGETATFSATTSGLSSSGVVWSLSSTSYGSISTGGNFTAGSSTSSVTIKAYATSVLNPAIRGEATIVLNPKLTLYFPSAEISGTTSATNRVTVSPVAPPGGLTVNLTSANPALASVPASVAIPAGSASAYFAITTGSTASDTPVNITASSTGVTSATGTITVTPPGPKTLTLSPTYGYAGVTTTNNTVTLTAASPPGATVVTFSSTSDRVILPAPLTIPAGSTVSAPFALSTKSVTANTIAPITVTANGVSKTANYTIYPLTISALSLGAPSGGVTGGSTLTSATLTLNSNSPEDGTTVTLSSSNPDVLVPPATVVVPAGVKTITFSVGTGAVTADTPVTLTATFGASTRSSSTTVKPGTTSSGLSALTLSQSSIKGGSSVTGTVTLSAAAPSGGFAVALSSSNAGAAPVPASVTVPAGSTTVSFTVATNRVAADANVTLTASAAGVTRTAALTVLSPDVSAVTLSTSSAAASSVVSGNTVTLDSAAPTGGFPVALTSSNTAAATVPASITVPAGATSASFSITALAVTTTQTVTITATTGATSRTATLSVVAPTASLSSLTLGAASVKGGSGVAVNTVALTAADPDGGTIALSSSHPGVVSVPASVNIPAGGTSASFALTTTPVAADTLVTITATYGGVNKTDTITVQRPVLTALSLSKTSEVGGTPVLANSVTIDAPAPAGGLSVSLSSSNPAAATVPSSVLIAAGSLTGTFTISTLSVTSSQLATITATSGGVSHSANLTVNPAPASLSTLTLGAASAKGGDVVPANTVSLSAPAPAGGVTVNLVSSDPTAATVPATVTVPAGSSSVSFAIGTVAVATDRTVSITATLSGTVRSGSLTVLAPDLTGVSLNLPSVTGGNPVTGSVALDSAAPAGGLSIGLSSNNAAVVVPSVVTVPAGASTASFSATTSVVTASQTATVSAVFGGLTRTATLTVNPAPASLSAIVLSATTVKGGVTLTGNTVSLTAAAPVGGAVVLLSSSHPTLLAVPASLTVPAGATSAVFSAAAYGASVHTSVTVTATYSGVSRTDTITVQKAALAGLSLGTTSVSGIASGMAVSGNSVTLDAPSGSGGITVGLTSSSPEVVLVPTGITVPEGLSAAAFDITVMPVTSVQTVTISASLDGVTRSATITVNPPPAYPALSRLLAQSATIAGGSINLYNRAYLVSAAPAGGVPITFTSSNPAVARADNMVIPAGASSGTFVLRSFPVTADTYVDITATNGTSTISTRILVKPYAPSSISLSSPITGGTTLGGYLMMNGSQAVSTVVQLFSSAPAVVSVPANVTIPANSTFVPFTVTTTAVAAPTTVTIEARYGTYSVFKTVTINPAP